MGQLINTGTLLCVLQLRSTLQHLGFGTCHDNSEMLSVNISWRRKWQILIGSGFKNFVDTDPRVPVYRRVLVWKGTGIEGYRLGSSDFGT
jgi:hypothetical protein